MNPICLQRASPEPPFYAAITSHHKLSICKTIHIYYLTVPQIKRLGYSLAGSSAQVPEAEIIVSVELQFSSEAQVLFQVPWFRGMCPLSRLQHSSLPLLPQSQWEPISPQLPLLPIARENSPLFKGSLIGSGHSNNLCVLRPTDLRLYLHLQSPFTAAARLVFD